MAVGAISTKSSPASCAALSASAVGKMPSWSPFSAMTRTSGARMSRLIRNFSVTLEIKSLLEKCARSRRTAGDRLQPTGFSGLIRSTISPFSKGMHKGFRSESQTQRFFCSSLQRSLRMPSLNKTPLLSCPCFDLFPQETPACIVATSGLKGEGAAAMRPVWMKSAQGKHSRAKVVFTAPFGPARRIFSLRRHTETCPRIILLGERRSLPEPG